MKNKKAWAIAVMAGLIVPTVMWAATAKAPLSNPSASLGATINCMVSGACTINVNSTVNSVPVQKGGQSFGTATPSDQITNWTGGAFSGDLSVGGTLAVAGDVTYSGAATITGTSTLSGAVLGAPKSLVITMTSATNTACAIKNNSGVSRIILSDGARYTATASVGSFVFTAGTSTGPSVTSTSPFVSTSITKSATLDVITPTSTLMTSSTTSLVPQYGIWRSGEWHTWIAATTSTQAGSCFVTYIEN